MRDRTSNKEQASAAPRFFTVFQSVRSLCIGGVVAALFGAQAHALGDSLADKGAVSSSPLDGLSRSLSSLFSPNASSNPASKAPALASNQTANSTQAANTTENRDVVLNWQVAYNATHYRVEQSTDGGQTFSSFTPVSTTEQALSLAPGVYHFRVLSCIEHHQTLEVLCDGVGQYSGVLEFDTASADGSDNNATLDWAQLANSSSSEVVSATLPTITPSTTNFYGATPGEAGVSGGAAVYNVPVVVVPGRNGMQPSVSLNYNSRNGNGIAGVGFGLSAGGGISRCPATRAQDGFNAGVDYTSTDRLCLDGQRLMVVSGTYGSDGAVYRTEIESLLSVEQTGNLSASNASFVVSAPNGTTRRYGTSTSSRVVATGKTQPMSWLLDREQDVSGKNHITYRYTNEGDGEVLLSDILYTGDGTTDGNRKVSFDYEDRAHFSTQYLAGGKTRTTKRLRRINTLYGTTKVRDYTLTYGAASPASGRSLLRSVQECGYVGSVTSQKLCRIATQFNWSDAKPIFEVEVLNSADGDEVFPATLDSGNWVIPKIRSLNSDVNGDGVRDLRVKDSSGNHYLMNAEGEATATTSTGESTCRYNQMNFEENCVVADFNLDGRTDSWRETNGLLEIGYSQELTPGDITVDWRGTTDVVIQRQGTQTSAYNLLSTADFNADGWPDALVQRSYNVGGLQQGELFVHLHTQNDTTPYQASTVPLYSYGVNNGIGRTVEVAGDMNGDGVPDLTVSTHLRDQVQPVLSHLLLTTLDSNNTVSFEEHDINFANVNTETQGHFSYLMDVNGDGLSDWLGWLSYAGQNDPDYLYVKLNQGDGTFGQAVNTHVDVKERPLGIPAGEGTEQQERYGPRRLSMFRTMDIDNNGTTELLIPGEVVVPHCMVVRGWREGAGQFAETWCGDELTSRPFQLNSGEPEQRISDTEDRSIRKLNAWHFEEDKDGVISVRIEQTELLSSGGAVVSDVYGKGLQDIIFGFGCENPLNCEIQAPETGSALEGKPQDKIYINRNYGAAASLGKTANFAATDYVPVDMLLGTDNGLRTVSEWVHKPLSSDQYDVALTNSAHSNSTSFYQTNFTEVVDGAPRGEQIHFASSMYAVAEFTTTDSSNVQQHKRFTYDGAVYNIRGRGFRGFNGITEIDLTNGLTTYTDFKQTFPFSSAVEKQYVFEGGLENGYGVDVRDSTNQNRALRELTQVWQENPNQQASWQNAGVYQLFSPSQTTVNRVLSNDTQALGTQTSSVTVTQAGSDTDLYGNAKKRTTTITDSYGTYTTVEEADFSSATDTWPNRYESRTVTKKAVIRSNGITDVATGTDTDKAVTTTVTWDTTHRKPDVVTVRIGSAANTSTDITTTDTNYNLYGLPTSISVTGDVLTGTGDSTQSQTRTTTTTYSKDGQTVVSDGYFPLTITQQATSTRNHTTTTRTNPHTGLPVSVTDIAGVQTATVYDSLARPVTISRTGFPDQHIRYTHVPFNADADENSVLDYVVMSIDTFQAGTPNTREFKDSSGRARRTSTIGFNGNAIHQDVGYNSRGLMTSESQPYYANNDSIVVRIYYLNFDALGRVQQKQSPQVDGTMVTDYQYNGLTTNITVTPSKNATSANTLSLSRTYNALEQLVKTEDALGGITQYAYDGAGNPIVIEDANQNRITAHYDALGRKNWVDDPNQGRTDFTYNDFGELEKEVDANGDSIRYEMDKLGRVTSRITDTSTATFIWDTQKHGLLTSQSENGSTQTYRYDNAARITQTTTSIDGTDYVVQTQYDSNFGRPLSLSYPGADSSNTSNSSGGLKIKYEYNAYGYLSHEKNAESDFIYREVTEQDVFGNIKAANINAGTLTGEYAYSGRSGQMLHSRVQQSSTDIHYLGYTEYDGFGNLAQQTNHALTSLGGAIEDYTYDTLHRLTQSSITLSGVTSHIDYGYDAVGNITKKSDYSANNNGAYSYTSGTNQISQITLKDNSTVSFGYDNKGNQTHRNNTREVTYNVFNKPTHIAKNATDITLTYGADLARFKQTRIVDGDTITTHYIDKLYEVEIKNGTNSSQTRTNKSYISDVAILTEDQETGFSLAFTHRDRLGSATTITDHNNQVTARRHFDPFGKPRGGDWSQLENLTANVLGGATLGNNPLDANMDTRRGFTDHEHLDEAEIIHMNGRVYDYNVGRFMSVDPVIQSPENSQSINPYSYIMNNPLSGTDPSGYCSTNETAKTCFNSVEKGTKQNITNSAGDVVGSISKDADGNVSLTSNGATGDGISRTINFSAEKVAEIGGQAERSKAPQNPQSGNNEKFESDKSRSSLSDDIKKQARTSLAQIATENGVNLNDGTVEAKFKDFEFDDEQNITGATVFCDRDCQIQAFEANRINANDIARAAMMINLRQSQTKVAIGFYQVAEKASYAAIGIEIATATAVKWALMSASQKVAWFSLTGELATVMNGTTIPKLGNAWTLGGAAGKIIPMTRSSKPIARVRGVPSGKARIRINSNGKYVIEKQK